MAKSTLITTLPIFFVELVLLLLTEHGSCCHFQWRFLWQKGRGTEKLLDEMSGVFYYASFQRQSDQREGGKRKKCPLKSSNLQSPSASTPQHLPHHCSALFPLEVSITGIQKPFYKHRSPPRALVCLQNW